LNFFSFPLLLFRSLFLSLEFVRLSHSLINTVLLCVTVLTLIRKLVLIVLFPIINTSYVFYVSCVYD